MKDKPVEKIAEKAKTLPEQIKKMIPEKYHKTIDEQVAEIKKVAEKLKELSDKTLAGDKKTMHMVSRFRFHFLIVFES